jgi:hypothetical protein
MAQITNTLELQTQLRTVLAMTEEDTPSKSKIAKSLVALAERLSSEVGKTAGRADFDEIASQLEDIADTAKSGAKSALNAHSDKSRQRLLESCVHTLKAEVESLEETVSELYGK